MLALYGRMYLNATIGLVLRGVRLRRAKTETDCRKPRSNRTL